MAAKEALELLGMWKALEALCGRRKALNGLARHGMTACRACAHYGAYAPHEGGHVVVICGVRRGGEALAEAGLRPREFGPRREERRGPAVANGDDP